MGKLEHFNTGLALLAANFNREVTTTLAEAYWTGLEVLTEDEMGTATMRALRECKFMPTVAELLDLAGKKPESTGAKAIEAWTVVRRTVDTHDYTASVDFGDLVNAIVANLGGWRWLCDLKLPDLDIWARKEFLRVYGELAHVDPSKLHGDYHKGFLNDKVSSIAIGGVMPKRLPSDETAASIGGLIRSMADAHSTDPAPVPKQQVALKPLPPVVRPTEDAARSAIESLRERVERSQRAPIAPGGHPGNGREPGEEG